MNLNETFPVGTKVALVTPTSAFNGETRYQPATVTSVSKSGTRVSINLNARSFYYNSTRRDVLETESTNVYSARRLEVWTERHDAILAARRVRAEQERLLSKIENMVKGMRANPEDEGLTARLRAAVDILTQAEEPKNEEG